MRYYSTFGFALATCVSAFAQESMYCQTEPYEALMAPGVQVNDGYGFAMIARGEWLFVSAYADDGPVTDAGSVHVFQLEGGAYTFRQKLLASGGTGPARFGFSLATDGDVLIVGADGDREIAHSNPDATGAAYVFRLQGSTWVQDQKLLPFGSGTPQRYGFSTAMLGNTLVIGAPYFDDNGVNNRGAAYVYRFDGAAFVAEQLLTSNSPATGDTFGYALAVRQDMIVVGAPDDDDQASNAGTAYVFTYDGQSWVQQANVYAQDAATADSFGSSIALESETLAIGAPGDDNHGALYLYGRSGGQWASQQKLTPVSNYTISEEFGKSVSLSGDTLIVGAPSKRFALELTHSLGAAYVFRRSGTQWVEDRHFTSAAHFNNWNYGPYSCWLTSQQPDDWPWPNFFGFLEFGRSVAITPIGFAAGATKPIAKCWGGAQPQNTGAAFLFADRYTHADCDSDGVPDSCNAAPDCNANYVPDACDIASGASADCNNNLIPDECEMTTAYYFSADFGDFAYGMPASSGNADMIWLNQFRVKPGAQVVTHISVPATPYLPRDTPFKVMLYADPSADGDPTDAVLLAVAESTALSHDHPLEYVHVPIPPTYVGEPGTYFFVGAVVHALYLNDGEYPWAAAVGDGSGPHRSWWAGAPAGQADITDLTNNAMPVQLSGGSHWSLRALASDCNGNGTWDACDIANGTLPDVNSNGIPDSCEVAPCFFADLVPAGGDGEVDVLDLLHVINNWGVCNPCYAICPGDTNDDCATNVIDLLAVINGWGPCR